MDERQFTLSEIDLPAAIRTLREALGRTEEAMAQILGCSLPAYQKWEKGMAIPDGEWMIRMLRLCPDEETRNAFRIRAERRRAHREKHAPLKTGPLSPIERRHCREVVLTALDALCECGEAGNQSADARLRDFAENLAAAANYYLEQLRGNH